MLTIPTLIETCPSIWSDCRELISLPTTVGSLARHSTDGTRRKNVTAEQIRLAGCAIWCQPYLTRLLHHLERELGFLFAWPLQQAADGSWWCLHGPPRTCWKMTPRISRCEGSSSSIRVPLLSITNR